MMRLFPGFIMVVAVINWSALPGFSQDKAPHNLSFRVGAGSSISIKHFSKEERSLNIPNSAFVNVQIATNLIQRNNTSLFLGLEMQTLNYYPTFNEKTTLHFASLLAGRTSKVDVTQALQLKFTGGLLLGTLTNVSSSLSGGRSYSGSPAKNMNAGLFNNLQVLFTGEKKDKSFDYGLGFDVVISGVPVYSNTSYPSYLKKNAFIQYGLSFNINYNFRKGLKNHVT